MATARWAKPCPKCGKEFVPGETEITKDDVLKTSTGRPAWVHADASECIYSNPRRNPRRNPAQLSPLQTLTGGTHVTPAQLAALAGWSWR